MTAEAAVATTPDTERRRRCLTKPAAYVPTDLVPACIFGPPHRSFSGRRQDVLGCNTGGQDSAAKVVNNEIARSNSHEVRRKYGYGPSDMVRHWRTDKGAETAAAAYHLKFFAKKRTFKDRDLMDAFNAYVSRRTHDGKRKCQARWRALFALQKLMDEEMDKPLGSPPVRLAGGDRALYELMFRAEPQKHISRPKFMTVMRRVYGFQIAPLEGRVNKSALRVLNEVYSTFDADGDGTVDWRCMLFMLRLAVNAQETVEANLKWGIALYSSPGNFDPQCTESMDVSDFRSLVFTMISFEKIVEFGNVLDTAWEALGHGDPRAGHANARAKTDGRGAPPQINPELLGSMLKQQPLKNLLRTAKRFGLRDRRAWTYIIEEEYYDPALLALVKARRRRHRNNVAIAIFLGNSQRRSLDVSVASWKRLVRRRKHCMRLVTKIAGRFREGNTSSAFSAIRRIAMASKACETIQRVYRGHLGRLIAAFLRGLRAKIIAIQAAFRGYRQHRKFTTWMKTKHLAAISIQRIVRGKLGRKRARCMVQEYFDREMLKVDAEVERLEYRNRTRMITQAQRVWRRRQNRRRDEAEKLRRIRIHEVEAEMKVLADSQAREAETYKRELSAWFRELREEQEKSRMLEEHTAKEKFKILCYRRREKDRLAEETRRRKRAAAEKFEEQRIEQWQMEWAQKAEERALALRKTLEAVLRHPDNDPERALEKSLQAEIKAQKKTILKMADNLEAELEEPEALAIAKEDIILRKMHEEREKVDQEMKAAATLYYEEEAKAKAINEEKMAQFKNSAADAAARVMQQMYYVFNATRTTQKRAKEVYTKHFDPQSLRYYWHNKQIDTYLWEKPAGLGSWDVDAADRWLAIPAAYSLHYYYNPKTYKMQWSEPNDVVLCQECSTRFSTRWCMRDGKAYCDHCYNHRHFSGRSAVEALIYKELDGAIPGSSDLLTYDHISDEPDITLEAWQTSEDGWGSAQVLEAEAPSMEASRAIPVNTASHTSPTPTAELYQSAEESSLDCSRGISTDSGDPRDFVKFQTDADAIANSKLEWTKYEDKESLESADVVEPVLTLDSSIKTYSKVEASNFAHEFVTAGDEWGRVRETSPYGLVGGHGRKR